MNREMGARLVGSMLVILLGCAQMLGQGSSGQIAGSVTDQSGGNVAGSTVTITDVKRGVSHTLVTDDSGEYVAPGLDPGMYKVRVEAKGFKAFERQNILLEVAREVRVDAVLQTGANSDVITVTEDIPLVDTSTATLGGTLNNEVINDLPLNGRNYQNLLTLRPGVMIYPGGGPWTQSTNGIRPEEMSYIVDGLPNDEQFQGTSITNAAIVIGDSGTILPIDAIQEFNTQVNPKAEFGWKTGAVTSVGLKSGTNELHGTAYAYGRSDKFDARNFFNSSDQPKVPVELEQWGTTVGGRIIPDKLFFFAGYEQQKYSVGSSLPITVPTTASLGGDPVNSIPDAIAAIQAAGGALGTLSPASLALLGCPTTAPFTPCTGALFGSNHQVATAGNPTPTGENPTYPNTNLSRNVVGKIDYHLSDHHSISGSYFFGNDALIGEDTPYTNVAFLTHVHSRAQLLATHWAWTPSSVWANELRFGVTRYTLSITPGDSNKSAASYGLNTGVTNPIIGGLPDIGIGGFTTAGNFFSFPKFAGPDDTYDVIDQVSHFFGKHALKFGGELRDMKVTQATWRRARGQISFGSLEDFLVGNPSGAKLLATTADPTVGSPERHMTQWGYAGFVQDDWRIKPRVTLNLGLRYEYATPPSEAHNLLGNFDPNMGLVQVGRQIPTIYKPDRTNFAPRLGVAWDVTGHGTTILRAGGGIAYDLITMNTFLSQQNTNNAPTLGLGVIPTGASIVVNGVTTPGTGTILTTGLNIPGSALNWPGVAGGPFIFPGNLSTSVQCGDGVGTDPGPCSILGFDRNYRTPWVGIWNLGIQHAFSSQLSVDVAYVGDHGGKLLGIRDLNQPPPTADGSGVGAFAAKFPYLGVINQLSNLYRSNYHGLQTTLTVRNYHGLGVLVGYTYSHALDNMSYNWNQYLPQDSLHPTADYSSSDFDIRHRFTASLTYAIPGKKTWGQLLEGWQLNSIVTLQSAQPWNAFDQNDNFSNTGEATDRWDLFGSPTDFKSGGPNSFIHCSDGNSGGCFQTLQGGAVTKVFSDAQTAAFWATCTAKAPDPGTLATAGCYVSFNGKSVLTPPTLGTFGTMGRNVFRDTGFRNVDFSVTKGWKFKERLTVQFRAEMFNVFNHPAFANPWDGTSGYGPANGFSDPSSPGHFGCGCATPDSASANPVLGSGGARDIQLGLKLIF